MDTKTIFQEWIKEHKIQPMRIGMLNRYTTEELLDFSEYFCKRLIELQTPLVNENLKLLEKVEELKAKLGL